MQSVLRSCAFCAPGPTALLRKLTGTAGQVVRPAVQTVVRRLDSHHAGSRVEVPGAAVEGKNWQSYTPLLKVLKDRRLEARRSVLVQVKGESSAEDLYQYCVRTFGQVTGLFYHQNSDSSNFSDFFIVEFDDPGSVDKLLSVCGHRSFNSSQSGSWYILAVLK